MELTGLITGFEPFGGAQTNASWEAVRRLPERCGRLTLHKLCLPVVYGQAGAEMLAAAEALRPALILCTGVAGGRKAVTPELIAVNWRSASIADNAGNQPRGERVDADGPDGIFTRLPIQAMTDRLREMDIPAAVSSTAGLFVCNDVFYQLMRRFGDAGIPCGFVHVPAEDALDPGRCSEALLACIRTAEERL